MKKRRTRLTERDRLANLSAQMQNQHVTRADQELVKMRDVTTNAEIPGAPETLGAIDDLSGTSDVKKTMVLRDRRLTRRYEKRSGSDTGAFGTRNGSDGHHDNEKAVGQDSVWNQTTSGMMV